MRFIAYKSILFYLLIHLLLSIPPSLASPASRAELLKRKITSLIHKHRSHMTIGVAIINLPSQEEIVIQGHTPYPLASIFKVPLLCALLDQIQNSPGKISLQTSLKLQEKDKCIGSGTLQYRPAGTRITVAQAVELMESISDNTAADMLFKLIGTDTVDSYLHRLGLSSSQIYLTNRQAWFISLGKGGPFEGKSTQQIVQIWNKMSLQKRKIAARLVEVDTANITWRKFRQLEQLSEQTNTPTENALVAATVDNLASPYDISRLLAMLVKGKLFNHKWTQFALEKLSHNRYNTRIPALLPSHIQVYHKTGTLAGIINDAGIIEISPHKHLVITVLIKNISPGYEPVAEHLIAQITQYAFRTFRRHLNGTTPSSR